MSEYHHYWDTRFGHIGVDRFDRETGFSRGRCREIILRIPLTRKWNLELATKGKDYLTLVGGPKYLRNIDWILDEFDDSFNALATASLRYHLDFSVCDNSAQREQYEDIIERLNEPAPEFTDEELSVLHPPGWSIMDDFEPNDDGTFTLRESTPGQKKIYQRHWEREDEWRQRIDKARHDFVDIIWGLWS